MRCDLAETICNTNRPGSPWKQVWRFIELMENSVDKVLTSL